MEESQLHRFGERWRVVKQFWMHRIPSGTLIFAASLLWRRGHGRDLRANAARILRRSMAHFVRQKRAGFYLRDTPMFRFSSDRALVALALLTFAILFSAPVQAAKLHFGSDEKLHVLAETKITNGGKPISLCYKTYTYFLIGGVYTTDEYVLCEGGTSTRYWPIPQGSPLASMQQQGLLPSPLPAYTRPTTDYVMGYSLWLLIVIVAVWGYLDSRRTKAAAPRKLAQLKTTTRRVMASVTLASATPDRSAAVARQIYQQLFAEPLAEGDFAEDINWVQREPTTFEGFLGAMGRQFDGNTRAMLLRTAAHVAMADGNLENAEATLLRHVAEKLGLKPKEADAFVQSLRRQAMEPGFQAA